MSSPAIDRFKGLNNVSDHLRLELGWLVTADNVDVTNTGGLSRREGYSRERVGRFTGAYSTIAFDRLYLTTATEIVTFDGVQVAVLSSTAPIYWAEINEDVYFNNGQDSGVIRPDHSVHPWRRDGSYGAGFLDDAGAQLPALFDQLPLGTDVIQAWKGRMYAAQYMPTENQTVVWFSEAFGFHLFNLDSDFFVVPGRVLMLAPTTDALVVGTDAQVFAYTGDAMQVQADYGVVPGDNWRRDDSGILFWSARGVCRAMPFANLTESRVSLAPGVRAGSGLIHTRGTKRFIALLQKGGQPFNAFLGERP
jgi:hypothetical protein